MAAPQVSLRRSVPAFLTYLRELWERREFATHLALGNLKARNSSTALGLFWYVLNPLLLGAIYGLVFGGILKVSRGVDAYVAYLLSGIFPFYFTRTAMTGGVNSILSNTKMLANLRFPRLILPISALFEAFVGFLSSLVAFFLIAGPLEGVWPGIAVVWLVPAILVHTVFNLGLAAITARIAVPFRDVNNLVPYAVRLWLYLSPIIYPADALDGISATARSILRLNPLYPILSLYRRALIGAEGSGGDILYAVAWAVGVAVIGIAAFVRYEANMARYV